MCGIAGIITRHTDWPLQQRLQQMTDVLAHRGPDGAHCWINPAAKTGLGHRRLAVIDLSPAAGQPMHYGDRYTIVYNGELYNYRELRTTLQQQGHPFHTQSDTEVILAAYVAYGTDCLQHFDGMFAFALWDEQEQTLFAARDRFGEKPFYYYMDQEQLLFASEIKALWTAGVPRQMSNSFLYNYITLGYTQNPYDGGETFYEAIRKLPARSYFLYTAATHRLEEQAYWDIDLDQHQELSPGEAVDTFRDLFTSSIKNRLRSDVAIGTNLSGGLDSSAIAAVIQQAGNQEQLSYQSFSIIFPGFERNEQSYINQVARHLQLENHAIEPTVEGLVADFDRLLECQEQPFLSSSVYAQYKIFELAAQHGITVLLDGQGADELLAGYPKYYHWYWQELARTNPAALPAAIADARSLGIQDPWGLKNKLAARLPAFSAVYASRQKTRQQKRHPDLESDFTSEYGQSYYYLPQGDQLNRVLYYNMFMNGLEELLHYADRNSMAHGREVRLPFLNHALATFVFALPATCKIKEGWSKWLLRQSVEHLLPKEIIYRKEKVGFEPPQESWMKNEFLLDRTIESKRKLIKKGILRKSALSKKVQPHAAHAAEAYDWRYLVAGSFM